MNQLDRSMVTEKQKKQCEVICHCFSGCELQSISMKFGSDPMILKDGHIIYRRQPINYTPYTGVESQENLVIDKMRLLIEEINF